MINKERKRTMVHALMCHHFHDEKNYIKSQGSMDAKEFEELLRYYRSLGFEFVGARQWLESALKKELKENQIAITFDDGLKCQWDIAEKVLEQFGITAFFFVPTLRYRGKMDYLEIFRDFRFSKFPKITDFYRAFFEEMEKSNFAHPYLSQAEGNEIDFAEYLSEFPFYTEEDRKFRYFRDEVLTEEEYVEIMLKMMQQWNYDFEEKAEKLYLSPEELRALDQKGHVIGLHSHSHYTNLAAVSEERQRQEYTTNQEILSEILGKEIITASYPCNSYNESTLKIMEELGIKIAFRANMEEGFESLLEIPREDHSNVLKKIKKG